MRMHVKHTIEMKQQTTTYLLVLCCLWQSPVLSAGDIPADDLLPIDPRVQLTVLPNGLHCYVRTNSVPENWAELRVVVKVGSILETEDQAGLVHFLEHMALEGTKHFPGQEMMQFLEKIGLEAGTDVNAKTSYDQTVYKLRFPTDNHKLLKKAVLILSDWARGMNFDPVAIDKERGIILEEMRLRSNAQARLREKEKKVLFYKSRYIAQRTIGEIEFIEKAQRLDVLEFYKRWYRPDTMAIVAVGDFDSEVMTGLIARHFSDFKKLPDVPDPPVFPIPDHNETLLSIESHPELTSTSIRVGFKHSTQPILAKTDYQRSQEQSFVLGMLLARLKARQMTPDPPYLNANLSKERLGLTKEVVFLSAEVPDGAYEKGLKALLVEIERCIRHGFTPAELKRMKRVALRLKSRGGLESRKQDSASHAADCINHFMYQEPIIHPELEAELAQGLLPGIALEEVNQTARQMFPTRNRVILYRAPEKTGFATPSIGQLRAVLTEVDAMEIESYTRNDVEEIHVPVTKTDAGSIVIERAYTKLGIFDWTLSNGIRVLLKPTRFKNAQILMEAYSSGGMSRVETRDLISARIAPQIVLGSSGGSTDPQVQTPFSGNFTKVIPYIEEHFEGLRGSTSPGDLERFFQMLYRMFVAPRADEDVFNLVKLRMKASVENAGNDPMQVLSDEILKALYNNHPRYRPYTLSSIADMDMHASYRIYQDRFADASDFTFVFVGSFEPEQIKPYLEKYVASLPSLNREDHIRNTGPEPVPGRVTITVNKGTEAKGRVHILFHTDAAWSNKDRVVLRATAELLKMRLYNTLREDQGQVYNLSVDGELRRQPKESYFLRIAFWCHPKSVDELMQITLQEMRDFQTTGPTKDQLAHVRALYMRKYEAQTKDNLFWLVGLSYYLQNGLNLEDILCIPDI